MDDDWFNNGLGTSRTWVNAEAEAEVGCVCRFRLPRLLNLDHHEYVVSIPLNGDLAFVVIALLGLRKLVKQNIGSESTDRKFL